MQMQCFLATRRQRDRERGDFVRRTVLNYEPKYHYQKYEQNVPQIPACERLKMTEFCFRGTGAPPGHTFCFGANVMFLLGAFITNYLVFLQYINWCFCNGGLVLF